MIRGPQLNHKISLSPEILRILKEPFGILLEGNRINRESIIEYTKRSTPVISVGDATTDRLGSLGIVPDLSVVDGREQRLQRTVRGGEFLTNNLNLECHNPAGSITENAVYVLQIAIEACTKVPVRVNVRGEEDLLVIPILLMVPCGSTVMYGQPYRGIVIVRVDQRTQNKAKHLLERLTKAGTWK